MPGCSSDSLASWNCHLFVTQAVSEQIAFSNGYYGGDAPAGSRILFPNGNVDPWHGLGVNVSPR